MRRVNESTIVELASWGVSFGNNWYDRCLKRILGMLEWDLNFGNIGLFRVFTSISPFFYVLNLFANWEKVFKNHSCMHWPSSKDLQNLAFACNKTWDDGRREMIGLSSPNTYEKNNKQLLIKQIQRKMNKAKSILYLQESNVHLDSPTVFWS